MKRRNWLVVGLIAVSALLVGCEQAAPESGESPVEVQAIPGSNVSRIILTTEAEGRIGLQTAAVQQNSSMPLAALVYDREGDTWVYTVAGPLTYVRQHVTVARVTGDTVVLQTGPPPGTTVVTVGAAELLGSEYGVAGE
ncbi:MAG TPA: hypothetical protein VIC57_07935 [Candidatus Dormibacteraeota bacterium]